MLAVTCTSTLDKHTRSCNYVEAMWSIHVFILSRQSDFSDFKTQGLLHNQWGFVAHALPKRSNTMQRPHICWLLFLHLALTFQLGFSVSFDIFSFHIYYSLFFSPQNSEKQMRQLAVIPPMLFDAEQQRIKFINMNGLICDPMKVYKDRQVMNMWSEQEKDTFREKYVLRLACLLILRERKAWRNVRFP